MPTEKVTVIILNYNGVEDTIACVKSIENQEDVDPHIIVVDNGSLEDNISRIQQEFPSVEIIENKVNLGYSEGNNRGIQAALDKDFDFIFVVNNDIVLSKNCLKNLVSDISHHLNAGAVTPISFFFDKPDLIYFGGGEINKFGYTLHKGIGSKNIESYSEAVETDWISGCAIMFRSQALREVGLFEAKFFLLFEDVDWCYRARRMGYKLRFVPSAVIWHKVSATIGNTWSPKYFYYFSRNALLCIERNFPIVNRPYFFYHAIRRSRTLLNETTKNDDREIKKEKYIAIINGWIDYIFRKFGERRNFTT